VRDVSEPWEDEGFGTENDWGEESLENEESELFDPVDGDDGELDEGELADDDDEQ
jgi:hypothetical protein